MEDPALAHVVTLAAADSSVALGPAGYAAIVTDQCRAYLALADDPAAIARVESRLEDLVVKGPPGAIVYAALLLRKLGRDVAPLLEPYRDDRRACSVFPGGCASTTSWLCEAVHWVSTGQHWSHPERLLGYELEAIERAKWFELPSDKVLRLAREGRRRDGRLASGNWVFTFAELLVNPEKLRLATARLRGLLLSPASQVRLYAALLLRAIEPEEGEAALANLATSALSVHQLEPRWFGLSTTTRALPVGEIVRTLASWPSP